MIFLLLVILALLLLEIQDEFNRPTAVENIVVECPGCGKEVDLDWIACPHCLQRLRENCTHCENRKMISHHFCTVCGSTTSR